MPQLPKAYHTNLASEFYVLSLLHRLGVDATLTLGSRKGIDIVVVKDEGDTIHAITVEVKGARGTTGWWVNNVKTRNPDHYIVFVGYKNRMTNLDELLDVWVIPSEDLDKFIRPNPNNKVVGPERLEQFGSHYRSAWTLITE